MGTATAQSFGTVDHAKGHWLIYCEPHVRARLKRVFPRAPQQAADCVRLSATPENSRELEWFLQRYPMDVRDVDQLRRLSMFHADQELRLAELLANRSPLPTISLAEPARDYQVFAAAMLAIKRGLLLADDVGVGKTVSAICSMVNAENLPALVVCPAHMPRQWAEALHRFAPQLKVHRIRKGQPYPLIKAGDRGRYSRQSDLWPERLPDVLISSYHMLRGWAETLAQLVRYVVFDECQALRSPGTGIHTAAQHVAKYAPLRLGLSATPIHNFGGEFFHVVDVLRPGALGTYGEFMREWSGGESDGGKPRLKDAAAFGAFMRREGIMLRRTRADVGRELPGLTKIVHTVDSDATVLDKLGGDAVELAKLVLQHNERFRGDSFRGDSFRAAGEFDALMRQATGIAKAPYVAEFVRLLVEGGERVLLFGWHREVYNIWMEKLKDLEPTMYTGSESETQKRAAIERFCSPTGKVLIMSLRSGAGVDGLQHHCRTVVNGELDWSPAVLEQNTGRVARDGQRDPVMAYFLVSDDGADPIMADVLGLKREQLEGVRNPDTALAERADLGENHLRKLAAEFLRRRGESVDTP